MLDTVLNANLEHYFEHYFISLCEHTILEDEFGTLVERCLGMQFGNAVWERRFGTLDGNIVWECSVGALLGNMSWEHDCGTLLGNMIWESCLEGQEHCSRAPFEDVVWEQLAG